MKIGLTSVTFRNKNIQEIIEIASNLKLDAIELGSDVHVPINNDQNTSDVYKLCKKIILPFLHMVHITKEAIFQISFLFYIMRFYQKLIIYVYGVEE